MSGWANGRLGRFRKRVRVGSQGVEMSYIDVSLSGRGSPDPLPGGEEARRTPIVFIHGATGCAVQWEGQIERLADRHRIFAIDLRGHGQSEKPLTSYRVEDFMDDVEDWMEAVALPPRFHLVGHSFGGYLSTLIATRHPERVERLVLMNTTGNLKHLGAVPRRLLNLPLPLLTLAYRACPVLVAMPPRQGRLFVAQALHAWECWDLYRLIRCPTMVLTGRYDGIAPPDHARRIGRLIADSRVHVVPWSRHMTMMERPGLVARLLDRFLHRGYEVPE